MISVKRKQQKLNLSKKSTSALHITILRGQQCSLRYTANSPARQQLSRCVTIIAQTTTEHY